MKNLFLCVFCFFAYSLCAAPLPDNVYFRAMQDEMARTKKELRVKGSAKPFFIAYKLIEQNSQSFKASFGAPYASDPQPKTSLRALVYLYSGDAKDNSSGFYNDAYYYFPVKTFQVPSSYEGIRRALWNGTDLFYARDAATYEKKMAYKRQKNITDGLPDFTKAPQGVFVEEIPAFEGAGAQEYQKVADELSALGKQLPYAELFLVSLNLGRQDFYFLDSEGDFYQYSLPTASLRLRVNLRTREGYKETLTQRIALESGKPLDRADLLQKTQAFAARAEQMYHAKKAEPYLGPVLLEPEAAGGFFNQLFVRGARYSKPLLFEQSETDPTAGQFKDKLGMRVMSHLFDVYDRPRLRQYQGQPLAAFMPVDDEGVPAQDLQLVQSGKLTALPSTRSPIPGQKQSNGRARMTEWMLPRAGLTQVFFEPKNPSAPAEMENKLLKRCRELELEYCYIFPRFPSIRDGQGELNFAERIYTSDGRKEPVYGLRLEGVTARSLRDVLAAGDDAQASYFTDPETDMVVSVVAPSVIVDELEILPTQRKPDRKPFVAHP